MKLAYSQLDKHLASGKLAAAYVLRGDQYLFRELALNEIRKTALGDTTDEFNLERFDGEKTSAELLVMAANTLPLLGLTGGVGNTVFSSSGGPSGWLREHRRRHSSVI